MENKLPKEWQDAFDLVKHNICDTRNFILIKRKFDNVLMEHRNLNNLFITFGNAFSCAAIITFYKVLENGNKKKSLAFLFHEVIKKIDKKECVSHNIGNKMKKVVSIRKRIKPLRDRIWGHALDFRKPIQGMWVRKSITTQELDSYVNLSGEYFNEIIELFENAGYFVSIHKIDPVDFKKLEAETDKFLSVNPSCFEK